jgi:hypothetical protein
LEIQQGRLAVFEAVPDASDEYVSSDDRVAKYVGMLAEREVQLAKRIIDESSSHRMFLEAFQRLLEKVRKAVIDMNVETVGHGRRVSPMAFRVKSQIQQRRIAALRRDVDAHRALDREAQQGVGAAGLGAGAGQALAAERLDADHGAGHRAVDVAVAGRDQALDVGREALDPRVDAQGQAIAAGRQGAGDLFQVSGL